MAETGNPFAPDKSEAILREIRDELRTSHQTAGGAAGPTGRPSPGFIAAQQTVDRMVAGEWAQMGWANAYSSSIKSSLANDIMGTFGMRAAPQSMWQREYEVMSRSMLSDRITSFPADLIMPGFGRRSRDMGAQMYQLSGRFARGDGNVNTDFHATMNMAREMQIGAATDMRLSGQDYSSILSHSANAGQFDMAGGMGDVKTQFNELRNAVADLTKTMRLGAGEVAQTMGAFRQFGIVDVADQKRMAERLASTARVAGVSTPEMAEMVRGGITGGLQLGLGAAGSAALAENLAMGARTASRSGLISGHIMAAAGGVQGMVQSQQAAIDRFASSGAGYYTLLGGAAGSQGGALDDILAGVGATGGTMGGIAAAEARKQDLLGGLSGGQRQRLYNRNLSQQMTMIGIDPNSAEATDYAFSMVRGQMGDAAGLAYARQNFSAEGRKERWNSAFRTEMGVVNQRAQSDYQYQMENETIFGRLRQAQGELGAGLGRFGMSMGRGLSNVGHFFGADSTFQNAATAMGLNGDDALTAESAASAAMAAGRSTASGFSREQAVKLTGSVSTAPTWLSVGGGIAGGIGGALAGGWAGVKLGAAVGMAGSPIGSIGGAIVGGLAGAAGGAILATAMGGRSEGLTIEDGSAYRAAFNGANGNISARAMNIAGGKSPEALNDLSSKQAFKDLLKNYTSGGKLSDADSKDIARLAKLASDQTGISVEDVMGTARALGVDVQLQQDYNSAAAGAARYEATMGKVLNNVESSKLSIASTEVAVGVQAFARATNDADRNLARGKLSAAGISGRGLTSLMSEIEGMDANARNKLVEDAGSYVGERGTVAANKRYNAFNRVAENFAAEAGAMNQAGGSEAYARIKELEKDPRALMDIMLGGGDAKDAGLRDFLIRQDDSGTMGKLKELGKIEDLMSTSSDDRFQKVTGLDSKTIKTLRDQIGSSSASPTEKHAQMRAAASAMMIGSSTMMKQASDPANIAASNMLLAANILREIQGKISNATSEGGKK